jgi:hypothetical protein
MRWSQRGAERIWLGIFANIETRLAPTALFGHDFNVPLGMGAELGVAVGLFQTSASWLARPRQTPLMTDYRIRAARNRGTKALPHSRLAVILRAAKNLPLVAG